MESVPETEPGERRLTSCSEEVKIANLSKANRLTFTIAATKKFKVYEPEDLIKNATCLPRCSDCGLLYSVAYYPTTFQEKYQNCRKNCWNTSDTSSTWFLKDPQELMIPCPDGRQIFVCDGINLTWTDGSTTFKGPPYEVDFACPNEQPECQWWNTETNSWSKDGCQAVNYTETGVICKCDHATDFGSMAEGVGASASATLSLAGSLTLADLLKILLVVITILTT